MSPIAGPAILALLTERRYQPFEFTSVMYRPIGEHNLATPPNPSLHIHTVGEAEGEVWARTAAEGWSETAGAGDFILTIGRILAVTAGAHLYLAELEGRPIAAATLYMHEGVALMGGASTIPSARGRGAQLALLERRLQDAFANGCDIGDDGRASGEHFAAECRASRLPHRVHADQMETDMNRAKAGRPYESLAADLRSVVA